MKLQAHLLLGCFLIASSILGLPENLVAQESGLRILRQTVGVTGYSEQLNLNERNYTMQASIGQASVIGIYESDKTRLQQGFIQPPFGATYLVEDDSPIEVTLYPNPFSDFLTLRFTEEMTTQVSVYDLMGKLIFQTSTSEGLEARINMPALAEGMYLLKISNGKRQFSGRIQKLN